MPKNFFRLAQLVFEKQSVRLLLELCLSPWPGIVRDTARNFNNIALISIIRRYASTVASFSSRHGFGRAFIAGEIGRIKYYRTYKTFVREG